MGCAQDNSIVKGVRAQLGDDDSDDDEEAGAHNISVRTGILDEKASATQVGHTVTQSLCP